ncbi:sugar ABC transporter ATP-binding protein [Christensenellaceae bacterium OttesenSCG-928-K19]|nr:sugar ABC transporter ATP-binding protein [Christensenellaceae bacterium OttesenSCG-928-K19]
MSDVFLKVTGIKKSFGGVQALKGVDLEIKKGEVRSLAGENGCGKSTLIKVISGAHSADAGEVVIDGKRYDSLTPMDAICAGIQVIYQDFAVFPNLTVAENIALNYELDTCQKTVNWKEVKEIAQKAMARIGAEIPLDVLVERLSVANKQMVAICRALLNDAKLVIMDEPTTALTAREVARLFDVIRMMQENGIAVMIVTHKLDEVYEIAETLTILRNGEKVAEGPINEFDRPRFIKSMTGRDIEEVFYRPEQNDNKILEVQGISREGAFQDVTFDLYEGDVLGITGLLGSGRGEIGEALFGMAPATSGSIKMGGQEIKIKSVGDAMKNGVGYVPEDRLTEGLFLELPIGTNTIAASVKSYLHGGRLDYKAMNESMWKWIKDLSVAAPSPEPPIKTLSGGNQQKVVLAKWLNTKPRLLILNGPTVGVDIGSKTDIHKILRGLVADGVGVIVISDDLPELIQNCNRVLIMRGGKLAGCFETTDLDETKLSALLSEQA